MEVNINEAIVNIILYPSPEDWLQIRNDFLVSKRKDTDKIPSDKLKAKYLFSEHTPIYGLQYKWDFIDVPYWISNQIVRSHEGIFHIVSSQRNDIQKEYNRKKAPQDAPVNLRITGNPVAIMTTSRKRTCFTASPETRIYWLKFLEELKKVDPLLAKLCVKPCVYRGGICPEVFHDCKFNKSSAFDKEFEEYHDFIMSFTDKND
jgi:hypothetical protein